MTRLPHVDSFPVFFVTPDPRFTARAASHRPPLRSWLAWRLSSPALWPRTRCQRIGRSCQGREVSGRLRLDQGQHGDLEGLANLRSRAKLVLLVLRRFQPRKTFSLLTPPLARRTWRRSRFQTNSY